MADGKAGLVVLHLGSLGGESNLEVGRSGEGNAARFAEHLFSVLDGKSDVTIVGRLAEIADGHRLGIAHVKGIFVQMGHLSIDEVLLGGGDIICNETEPGNILGAGVTNHNFGVICLDGVQRNGKLRFGLCRRFFLFSGLYT